MEIKQSKYVLAGIPISSDPVNVKEICYYNALHDDFFQDITCAELFHTKEQADFCFEETFAHKDERVNYKACKVDVTYTLDIEDTNKPQNKNKIWFVYFIQEDENEPGNSYYKIGYTNNLDKRISQLQTGSSAVLKYKGFFVCDSEERARILEKQLHELFKKLSYGGEWFLESDTDPVISKFLEESYRSQREDFVRYLS